METKTSGLPEITLKMLLDEGIVEKGTVFYSDTKPTKTAKINSEGCIVEIPVKQPPLDRSK